MTVQYKKFLPNFHAGKFQCTNSTETKKTHEVYQVYYIPSDAHSYSNKTRKEVIVE